MTFPGLPISEGVSAGPGPVAVARDRAIEQSDVSGLEERLARIAGTDELWTPTLEATTTNPGVSAVTGRQVRMGPIQLVWARFVFSSAGSGTYFVELPSTAAHPASSSAFSGQAVGSWGARDDSAVASSRGGATHLRTSKRAWFAIAGGGSVTAANPFTFASGDVLSFNAQYRVA